MGNSNRRRTEEDMQLNPSSHYRETENNHLNPQRILHFIRDNDVQQRTAKGKEDANSFGEIKFEGFDKFKKKTAPYIRVADDTPVEILWKLMIEEWKIPKPKMIISLTGGARYFVGWNEDRLKILFNQGLVKTVIKTDAWIITGGSAAG
ncbi:transient receptor potential cation channel subfamily M member-like 2 [Ptychodera flava]|uniref:transient receptor potential cation channel subfamily M member-like 2 n=1 Tax=Ptychodera flava TaxID=63121 RepID=UPI003969CE88